MASVSALRVCRGMMRLSLQHVRSEGELNTDINAAAQAACTDAALWTRAMNRPRNTTASLGKAPSAFAERDGWPRRCAFCLPNIGVRFARDERLLPARSCRAAPRKFVLLSIVVVPVGALRQRQKCADRAQRIRERHDGAAVENSRHAVQRSSRTMSSAPTALWVASMTLTPIRLANGISVGRIAHVGSLRLRGGDAAFVVRRVHQACADDECNGARRKLRRAASSWKMT